MLLQRKNQTSEIVKNVVLVGFILLFLATSAIINKTTDYDKLMIEISLGMLAFIAIFYSFILRKDIKNKRHEMISSEFGRFNGIVTKTLSDISKHQKSKPSYSFVKNNLQKISNELDAITLFVQETDMKKQLLLSFSSYNPYFC